MNNIELTAKVREYLKGSKAKAKKFKDLVAVSFSLISENTEEMYVAVRDGELLIDAYRYNDNNVEVEATAETIDKLFSGAVPFDKALADGLVQIKSGDVAKFKALEVLVGKMADEKKPAAKPEAKQAPAKEEKPAAKAETKPAAKASAKKPSAKKGAKK